MGVTWCGLHEQSVWAHEMGHTLGLPHSSGPYSQTYDSRWDVMSYPFATANATFGHVAEETISYHRDGLGWIPAERKATVDPGSQSVVGLQNLAQSASG